MGTDQILGLVTGIFFGFLLQKGRVLRFEKQVGAMLLKDMTILKFMLSAIMVAIVSAFGKAFNDNRYISVVWLVLPLIGVPVAAHGGPRPAPAAKRCWSTAA